MYRSRSLQQRINMFTWGRLVLLLSMILASLQLLYLVLLGRLEVYNARIKESHTGEHQQQQIAHLIVSFNEAIKSSHVIDTSGQYRIVYYLHRSDWDRRRQVTASEHVIDNDVSVVTQCSVNHLLHLLSFREVWQGPISVAVFMAQPEAYSVLQTIIVLVHCFPAVRESVSLHLVCPLTSKDIPTIRPMTNISCDNIRRTHRSNLNMTDALNYAAMAKYPNNLLRNVAKYGARTAYVFVIDIDMLPNTGLDTSFIKFLKQITLERVLDNRTVYVVPSFEIDTDAAIPKQKDKLLEIWQRGLVRPFYYELCWKCQRFTEYDRWRNLKHDSELQVSYDVKWQDPWEPFYIAPRNVPVFDERFKQYGFNRISQACELHIAGFKFTVLNNAFLVHHGYKKKTGFHLTKDIEQEQNRILFRLFKEELKTKYADSTRRCY